MKIVLLSEDAKMPQRATEFAAGYDLFVPRQIAILPGRNVIKLDIAIALPPHTEGQVRPRSGFSVKGMEGIMFGGAGTSKRFDADVILGTIDEDYVGNIGVIIKSYESRPFLIEKHTKIAQLVVTEYVSESLEVVSELPKTDRGEGGFGHTGSK